MTDMKTPAGEAGALTAWRRVEAEFNPIFKTKQHATACTACKFFYGSARGGAGWSRCSWTATRAPRRACRAWAEIENRWALGSEVAGGADG